MPTKVGLRGDTIFAQGAFRRLLMQAYHVAHVVRLLRKVRITEVASKVGVVGAEEHLSLAAAVEGLLRVVGMLLLQNKS